MCGRLRATLPPCVMLHNTIVAGNSASVSADVWGELDNYSSYNLFGQATVNGITDPSNQLGESDPGLAPLGDYGGPTTTHALLSDSPAIDEGSDAWATAADQRGFLPRVDITGMGNDGTNYVDIGAFEVSDHSTTGIVVTTAADSGIQPGELSLRQALNLANELPGADTITFDPTVFGMPQTITLSYDDPSEPNEDPDTLAITGDVTIVGPGADLLTIDAGEAVSTYDASIFTVGSYEEGVTASISGMNLTGFYGWMAPVHSYKSDLTLEGVVIEDNYSDEHGAGVHGTGGEGSLTIRHSTIRNNTCEMFASAVFADSGVDLTIEGSTVEGNSGYEVICASSASIVNTTISGNDAIGLTSGRPRSSTRQSSATMGPASVVLAARSCTTRSL